MSLGILGKKIGMTQVFRPGGEVVPVTVIQAGPCAVIQKKTLEKDKYAAVQVGFEEKEEKRTSKPLAGHFKKHNATPKKFVQEFRVTEKELAEIKDAAEIKADIFKAGDRIDVIGWSKGRGFAGSVKVHNFHGFDAGHGTHEYFRHGGSVGQKSMPGRVFLGMRMPTRWGNERVTTQNVEIVDVKPAENLILIKGSVPGPNERFVILQKAVKYLRRKPKVAQPPSEKKMINPLKAAKKAAAGGAAPKKK